MSRGHPVTRTRRQTVRKGVSERCHGEHLTSPTRIRPRSSGHQPAKAGRLLESYNSSSPTPEGAVYGGVREEYLALGGIQAAHEK